MPAAVGLEEEMDGLIGSIADCAEEQAVTAGEIQS